jgi:predicted TPR repeat methyltransferase
MEQLESRSFVWQPDVYSLATMLGQAMRARILIDLGCGRATKLQDASRLFQVIGADTRENISWCREHLDYGKWVVADLESDQSDLLNPDEAKHAIIVCADVIEHLVDPLPLLGTLHTWLADAPIAILSTPDRVLNRGVHHLGPPDNPKHVREWQLEEFRSFLESNGFDVWLGLTRENTKTNLYHTIIAVLRRRES